MARIFIGVGANIDPEAHIARALTLLTRAVRITGVSTFYRTPALGPSAQPPFLNGVVAAETTRPPREIKFDVLRAIEDQLGRRRGTDRYAPRPIDLDLLLFDALVLAEEDLALPDPEIARRADLAVCLCELAPALVLPGDGRPVCEIAPGLAPAPMKALPEFTALLRTQITEQRGDHQ